jgi:Kef-type K+ transport system membrane component KefB
VSHTGPPKGIGTRAFQAVVLAVLFGLMFITTRAVPEMNEGVGTITSVGFLLLAGTLMSELVETIKIPHLTGYLLAGIIAGPHILNLIDHHSVDKLTGANTLALALIAFEGGAELKLATLKKGLRSLAWAQLVQSLFVLSVMTVVFIALRPAIPFVKSLSPMAALAVAVLWAALSVTRSPSAALGILSQTKASGPLATFTLTFVMASDVVVVILLTACIALAKPMIDPASTFSLHDFEALGRELLGSVALGTTLGLFLAAYIRLVGRQLILMFVALGFGLSEVMSYLHYDPLLAFMMTGFVVQNLSQQGEKFLAAIHRMGSVVYVIFFATAGAHLNIPLLASLWPIAVALAASRTFITWIAGRLASRLSGDGPVLKNWGFAGLVSQAGLALGLASVVVRTFPSFGEGFRALAIATVALNELFGPILFKFALDRVGETSTAPEPTRASLAPRPAGATLAERT